VMFRGDQKCIERCVRDCAGKVGSKWGEGEILKWGRRKRALRTGEWAKMWRIAPNV
jgi:hypothetical protein